MRRGQWVILTFNGDPDVTDNWNSHYMFDGMSIGSLDGNPLILRDTLGIYYKLHRTFSCIDRHNHRNRVADSLDYIHRNNYTMQIVTHFMSHTDNGRVTRLLTSAPAPRSRECNCVCIEGKDAVFYHFKAGTSRFIHLD
jgi:hypothetical protein